MLILSPTGESGGVKLNNGNFDIKGASTAQLGLRSEIRGKIPKQINRPQTTGSPRSLLCGFVYRHPNHVDSPACVAFVIQRGDVDGQSFATSLAVEPQHSSFFGTLMCSWSTFLSNC